jgi:hypothetical protein
MEAKSVQTHLISEIGKSMHLYKVLQSLFDEDSTESVSEQMRKYQTLAAQIKTLGGLLQCDKQEERMKILKSDVAQDLIAIMGHTETDPILLTAVCTFALDVFEAPEVENDAKIMKPFYEGTKSMVELMPYLGGSKYPLLVEKCAKYHSIEEAGGDNFNNDIADSLHTFDLFGSKTQIDSSNSQIAAKNE